MPVPPYVGACFGETNCSEIGVEPDLVSRIFRFLGFPNVLLIPVNSTEEGEALLSGGGADIFLPSLPTSASRQRRFHVSPVVVIETALFLTRPRPSTGLSDHLIFAISDYRLWLVFLAFFLALSAARMAGQGCERRWDLAFARVLWYLVSSLALAVYANFLAIAFEKGAPLLPPFSTYRELSQLLRDGQCRVCPRQSSLQRTAAAARQEG